MKGRASQSETEMGGKDLEERLRNLEGRSYREYKSIQGDYAFSTFVLSVDYVQGDPFAAPSRIRIRVSQSVARFPAEWITDYLCQCAIADYITRQVAQVAKTTDKKRGSGTSGKIEVAAPSQAILRRTAVWIDETAVELRLTVGLPALGRRIAGKAAAEMLCEDIPALVARTLSYSVLDESTLKAHIQTHQDAEALRNQLAENNLIAFIGADACLPRHSGIDERPLLKGSAGFVPPAEGSVTLDTPHSGPVTGLGICAGVTLIVGGGYHGKSTLLRAIEQGIYNHIPGDGRQQVVAHEATVKIRAEDGRSVSGVDISPVINRLPQGRSSQAFSTENASGSTSQAAALMEAVEAGAKVLLIDEDTAATNFMIRDRNMQALIAKDKEPITPFVDKVRQLYDDYGVSTILVMGGSGDYFAVADTVIAIEDYQPTIVTEKAKAIAQENPAQRQSEGSMSFGNIAPRILLPGSLPTPKGDRSLRVKARRDSLMLGYENIDLKAVEQIAEAYQVRAIAQAMMYADRYYVDGVRSLSDVLDLVMDDIERGGLDILAEEGTKDNRKIMGNWAGFRRFELAATINRLRTIKVNG